MAFKEVQTLDADTVIALGGTDRKTGKKRPQQIEGYYLGNRRVDSPKSKDGTALLHFLQTPKGNVGVWGKTDLDRKFQTVKPGTMVRATFTGMQPTPNGDMYKFKVETDDSNTIDVTELSAGSANESFGGTSEEQDADDNFNGEVVEDDEITDGERVATAAANQRKVQELLNRGKAAKTK